MQACLTIEAKISSEVQTSYTWISIKVVSIVLIIPVFFFLFCFLLPPSTGGPEPAMPDVSTVY